MLNKVELIGRLTHHLEMKTITVQGELVPKVDFQIAIPHRSRDEAKTQFVSCVAFRKVAQNLLAYLSKGSRLYLEGSLSLSTYQNSEGVTKKNCKVLVNEVVFLDSQKK